MAKEKREAIEQEVTTFGNRTYTVKTAARLKELAASSSERIAEHPAPVLEIARIKLYKRRRLKVLAQTRRDILEKLKDTGLIFAHHWQGKVHQGAVRSGENS